MSKASKNYNPVEKEQKWYQYWLDNKHFKSEPDDREPFTIVIPPPNVTGVLHMGHIMNNTIQDILIRRARMQGKNACWVPGTDHASIATEAKVVNRLKEQGVPKSSLTRDSFMTHAWEWTHEHGGIILDQLQKLGASCDWDRTKFTLDDELYESVIKVFIDLYEKGLIYRGIRMVNWDPEAKTAVSDEEVEYKNEQSKLYYVRYKIKDSDEYITIATTRPETILGDSAVCVHPEDPKYKHLHGKTVIIPLINREVPIIVDDYIDLEFGTGALKVTPAHDENDYKLGEKHHLDSYDIFNDDGTMSPQAKLYIGKDRFDVKKEIVKDLDAEGYMVKIEDYTNRVGYSQRTHVPVEPKLSTQWFLKMKDLAEPARENVYNNTIKFSPKRFKNTYSHWMDNIRDWNISRQLWWGHRIPAYYLPDSNDFVVAETEEKAVEKAKEKTGNNNLTAKDLRQDEDVLDTWFSSWLWPISVFDGIRNPDNADINYYYPTDVLATGHDIIFFWVARMIMAGYEYRGELPFKDVYYTGMVRDEQGRKMSKQLGNSPDPLKMIEKYGADGVRVGMMLCSTAGGDLLYEDSLPEQGRNFSNKIWNAYRLIESWDTDSKAEQPEHAQKTLEWFEHKFNKELAALEKSYQEFRLSEALMTLYKLFRDDFSSWLLEAVKPDYQQPIDKKTYESVRSFLGKLLQILHPFMPFITEEIWHSIEKREKGSSIMYSHMPTPVDYNQELVDRFELAKTLVSDVRKIRNEKGISLREQLKIYRKVTTKNSDDHFDAVIKRLGSISEIEHCKTAIDAAIQIIVKKQEYFLPLGDLVDLDEEKAKLQEELKYNKGFLNSVLKKLSNDRFVSNAPEQVVNKEREKQADAEAKIAALEKQIESLS
ncbi:MAG: valine--tRNA ligase [Bacteroidota bacterium]|nr:valine--tRNA ligase [Bacteroidota bacterium]